MWAVDFYLGVCGAGSAVSDVVYLVQATHQHFLLTATQKRIIRQTYSAEQKDWQAAVFSFCLSAVLFDAPCFCFAFRDREQFGNH